MDRTPFHSLSAERKRDALGVAARLGGTRAYLFEKDIWVVQTLSALFEAPFGQDLVFKGGTSLSKAYRAIRRFSEDVDVTYDIRRFVPELTADAGLEAIPPTRSQENRWTKVIRRRLVEWTSDVAVPELRGRLLRAGWPARLHAEAYRIRVRYEPLFSGYGFIRPEVLVEFGARSTGEPHEPRLTKCDAAGFLPNLSFPTARPSVMLPERTFWEKATAIHVFCRRARHRGTRLSRHWHDLVRLDEAGYAESAFADRELGQAVARHKSMFFREKDTSGNWIDYNAAVSGGLQLIPAPPLYEEIAADYDRMVRGGMLLDDSESFEDIMTRCADIEARANAL